MSDLKPCPWCGGEADYPAEMCGSHVKSMEVIGNIHDNPEILKEASHND